MEECEPHNFGFLFSPFPEPHITSSVGWTPDTILQFPAMNQPGSLGASAIMMTLKIQNDIAICSLGCGDCGPLLLRGRLGERSRVPALVRRLAHPPLHPPHHSPAPDPIFVLHRWPRFCHLALWAMSDAYPPFSYFAMNFLGITHYTS